MMDYLTGINDTMQNICTDSGSHCNVRCREILILVCMSSFKEDTLRDNLSRQAGKTVTGLLLEADGGGLLWFMSKV